MKYILSRDKFEILHRFEDYIEQGGSVITFAEYYLFTHEKKDSPAARYQVLLGLCEQLTLAGRQEKMYHILNTIFSLERWQLNNFKSFMSGIAESDTLAPYHNSIFSLHENCKNYIKSC